METLVLLKLDSFHGCWGCCGWHRRMVKTSFWLGSDSSVGWWAATVATYCSRRKAEHPKFESTEGFNHSTVSPCSGGEVGTGMGGGCRNYLHFLVRDLGFFSIYHTSSRHRWQSAVDRSLIFLSDIILYLTRTHCACLLHSSISFFSGPNYTYFIVVL